MFFFQQLKKWNFRDKNTRILFVSEKGRFLTKIFIKQNLVDDELKIFRNREWLQLFPVLVMLVMVTCAVYQILTLVFKVTVLSIVVIFYLGVSISQALNEVDVEPAGRWLAGVLVIFFMACLVAHSQHTEATYRSDIRTRFLHHYRTMAPKLKQSQLVDTYISKLYAISF